MKTVRLSGKTYGLPFSASPYCMFYNVDWLTENGLPTSREDFPKTWDGLIEVSAKATKWDGDMLAQIGAAPWMKEWFAPVWIGTNGGQLYNSTEQRYHLNDPQNVQMLEIWVKWLKEQYKDLDHLRAVGDFSSWRKSPFPQRKSVIDQGGAWNTAYTPLMNWEELGWKWNVGRFPVGPSGNRSVTTLSPNFQVIPTGTKHPQQAFLLMEAFSTYLMSIWYRDVLDIPVWLDFPTDTVTQALIDNVGQEDALDMNAFFRQYMQETVEAYTSPVEDFGNDQLYRAMDQVLRGAATAQQALDEAQLAVQNKLEETLKTL